MAERSSREGQRVPEVELAQVHEGHLRRVKSRDLFAGKRVIVFALPGAFTPTCSTAHVPGYVAHLRDFREAGIADVICLSVNDPYVMDAWHREEKAQGIHFVADPFAEFTRAMGMAVDNREALLGVRSWRYSMVVKDGTIEKMYIEPAKPGDPFEVSDAETMLRYLRPGHKTLGPALMLARHGCPYCARAKRMLDERRIPYEAVHIGEGGLTMQGVKAATGVAKVPQVYIGGQRIGGAEELERWLTGHAGSQPQSGSPQQTHSHSGARHR